MRRSFPIPILPGCFGLMLIVSIAACGKSDSEASRSTGMSQGTTLTAQTKSTFRPETLLSDARTAGYTVELPVIRVKLGEPRSSILSVKIVVECGDEAGQRELKRRSKKMGPILTEIIGTKNMDFVNSLGGKMKIRDEIAARLQELMIHKTVKQVYFVQYVVVPGS